MGNGKAMPDSQQCVTVLRELNGLRRFCGLHARVATLVHEGKRDLELVANVLQQVIDRDNVGLEIMLRTLPLSPAAANRVIGLLDRAADRAASAVPTEKFGLLVDLGIITVPSDYVHGTRLGTFMKENRKKFYGVNDNITDKNFPNPTRILKPGDRLHVRAYQQIVPGTTTSEERLAFLATQKAIHTGAQGASLVFEQKRDQLPKGRWYASFDEPNRLWKDAGGRHGVPRVDADSDGDFNWSLGCFERVWDGSHAFLCFCDVE